MTRSHVGASNPAELIVCLEPFEITAPPGGAVFHPRSTISADGETDRLVQFLEQNYLPASTISIRSRQFSDKAEPFRQTMSLIQSYVNRRESGILAVIQKTDRWMKNSLENLTVRNEDNGFHRWIGAFKDIPAVIVGAGPSLDRNIDQLNGSEDKLLILAANTAADSLFKKGIQPHIIGICEDRDVRHKFSDLNRLSGSVGFLLMKSHPAVARLPFERVVFATSSSDQVAREFFRLHRMADYPVDVVPSVSIALMLRALEMGCNPIILVGQDLAYSDGRTYASGTAYSNVSASLVGDGIQFSGLEELTAREDKIDEDDRSPQFRDGRARYWIDGLNGERLATNSEMFSFRETFNEIGRSVIKDAPHIQLVNCTEGGARIASIPNDSLATVVNRLTNAGVSDRVAKQVRGVSAVTKNLEPVSDFISTLRREFQRDQLRLRKLITVSGRAELVVLGNRVTSESPVFGGLWDAYLHSFLRSTAGRSLRPAPVSEWNRQIARVFDEAIEEFEKWLDQSSSS